jgi:hypothetical protein
MIHLTSMGFPCRVQSKETAVSNFRKQYPDFASIEFQIRQAHAERSVAIATAVADGILKLVRGVSALFASKPAAVKASAARPAANA